jgi:lactoylglutathione lyase
MRKNQIGLGLCCLAALAGGSFVFSKPAASTLEFDHTTVQVKDVQKSAEFYDKVMGLPRIANPFKDEAHVWYRIGPHSQLHVVAGAKEGSQADIEHHFAFRVASVTAFAAHLDTMHVSYRNIRGDGKTQVRPDGVHQIYFQDPDGYWIEVNDDKF